MAESTLEIRDLHVSVGGKEILKGVNLTVRRGEIHALMGPNGSGKSTLSYTLMGHPHYTVTQGDILLDGVSLLGLTPDERARRGLFLAMQYPVAIPGVTLQNFLHVAVSAQRGYGEQARQQGDSRIQARLMPMGLFRKELDEQLKRLQIDPLFLRRYLNEGFSGGEKKRAEILQLALLRPAFAVLDEPDSGLDIDAVRIVSEGVNRLHAELQMGLLVITHYQRILNYIQPQLVHIFYKGQIVQSGDAGLVAVLEERGYEWLEKEVGG
jgi:Fe-S cluster assembly ATP-binding protein